MSSHSDEDRVEHTNQEEIITRLKRGRSGHLGEITKIINLLDVYFLSDDLRDEVIKLRERLNEQWKRYLVINDELKQLNGKSTEHDEQEHYKHTQRFQSYVVRIDEYVKRNSKDQTDQSAAALTDTELKHPVEHQSFRTTSKGSSSKASTLSKRSKGSIAGFSISSSLDRDEVRIQRILAERKVELLKRAKERRLNEEKLRLDNEIAEAEDEADFARTRDSLYGSREGLNENPGRVHEAKSNPATPQVKTEGTRKGARASIVEPRGSANEHFSPPLTPNVIKYPRLSPPCNLTPSPVSEDRIPDYHKPPPVVRPNVPSAEFPGHIMTKLTGAINSIVTRSNLPPLEVLKFNGDPCAYYQFKSRFYEMVDSQNLTEAQKMTRLLQFLDGEPRNAVSVFEGIPGGLWKAMRVLDNRYGQPHIITKACVDAMIDGPNISINDRKGLRHFADRSRTLYETLSSINALSEMNMTNMAKMCHKLPISHQLKWREQAQRIREHGRNPSLLDMVEFIEKRADVVNDPIFGAVGDNRSGSLRYQPITKGREKPKEIGKISSMSVGCGSRPVSSRMSNEAESSKYQLCVVCENPHKLEQCQSFKAKSLRQRSNIVRIHKLCINCLRRSHFAAECRSTTRCSCCRGKHHTLLHKERKLEDENPEKRSQEENLSTREDSEAVSRSAQTIKTSDATTSTGSYATAVARRKTSLQVIPVRVSDGVGESVATYALLDTGSEESFVTRSLADRMKLKEKSSETLTVCTLNGETTVNVGKVNVVVEPFKNPEHRQVSIKDVKIVDNLNINPFHPVDQSKWSHLEDIEIPEINEDEVTILIGANVPEALIQEDSRIGKTGEPFAVRTVLGWAVLGPVGFGSSKTNVNFVRAKDEGLDRQLQQLIAFDNIGTTDGKVKEMSKDDRTAQEILHATSRIVNGHYEVGMLWKSENVWMPDNKIVAEARLRSLKRKLERNKELHRQYRSFITNHLDKGYARKLTSEEAIKRSNKTWYLPHHAVFHPKKPNKIRVVFNAASIHDGSSLNNQLYTGPDLTNNLVGVLLRFRQERVALVADIEAMFHQVKVPPEDADSLRFLWWETEDLSKPPAEYQMTSHIFGAADSPSCASYCLKRTADDNKSCFPEEVIETVKRDFYVDDLLKAVSSNEKAVRLANNLIELLQKGGFRLTKWMSNSREVLGHIAEEERAKPSLDLDLDQLPVERTLGVEWDVERDVFQFMVNQLEKPCTKRGILSTFSSLYDPLGLVCPVLLEAKKIMQRLWQAKVDWDEPIPEQERFHWEKWKLELSALCLIKIPRCYLLGASDDVVEITLHLFSDASEEGYGMCAYLRFLHHDGTVHCSFLFGKSKTSPLKPITMPRLELQAATLAARIYVVLKQELTYPVKETFFWTDSQTTLQYIKNRSRRFHTYVANRIAEINEVTSPDQWRHCPGKLNPADDASRGMNARNLSTNHRWWNGPDYIWRDRECWPETQVSQISESDPEARKEVTTHQVNATPSTGILQRLINYHSNWIKLQRSVAWLVRFIEWLRNKRRCGNTGILALEELDHAGNLLLQAVQKEHFKEELDSLNKGDGVNASSSILRLKPIIQDGILRVGGRLEEAPLLSFSERHPAIVPKDHHVGILILRHYHKYNYHTGREQTLAQSRRKFWIIAGRNLAKKIVRDCRRCRRFNSRPMTQIMAPLPAVRLESYNPPFTTAGVDFFGPILVKQGRKNLKRWGCLFTCLTTRAVYLDVAPSLQTDDFILLLRQFISRRGPPKEIRSDQGTNFVGTHRELQEATRQLDQTRIERELREKDVKWVFHPPTASHMSGVWERLVQTVKKHLKTIIGDRLLNEFALRTLLAEIEFIMNNRPLVPASDDPTDLEALTPNHFLLQRRVHGLPPGVFVKQDYLCRKQWRKVQFLTELFWKRWMVEYLPRLQERQKWLQPRRNLQAGELVIIKEDGLPRNKWIMGRVLDVFAGKDGKVRSAKVKTATAELHRPITKLCLLEGNI